MKTFENRFGAIVELREVGARVVAVRVSTSMRLDRIDGACISEHILSELLPAGYKFHPLYDGSYLVVAADGFPFATNLCVPCSTRSLAEFKAAVELDDGLIHTVHFSLDQRNDVRYDYCVTGTRFIHLRGKAVVEVDDYETPEE